MPRLPSSRPPIRGTLIPGLFCLIALILNLLVLFAGVNNKLTPIYYLKTDASKLSLPSKLSTSDFLKDLSQVSGADYVGQPQTASSLGIAETYTIHLLTACGHFSSSSSSDGGTVISCSPPSLGFAFHPGSTLRLDSTSLDQSSSNGVYSSDLVSALSRYSRLSRWLAGAYITSALFLLITIAGSCVSLGIGAFTSFIATVTLLSATIGGAVVFGNVNGAFNSSFRDKAQLSSSLGRIPTALGLVACGLATGAMVMLVLGARRAARAKRTSPLARSVGGKGADGLVLGAGGDPYAAPGAGGGKNLKGAGLLGKVGKMIPGQRHKYVQVEAQPALARTDVGGRRRGGSEDEDWGAQDEYSHGSGNNTVGSAGKTGADSVPLVSLGGNKASRDLNSAYEPYSSQPTTGH